MLFPEVDFSCPCGWLRPVVCNIAPPYVLCYPLAKINKLHVEQETCMITSAHILVTYT